jgi:hypothetical protein
MSNRKIFYSLIFFLVQINISKLGLKFKLSKFFSRKLSFLGLKVFSTIVISYIYLKKIFKEVYAVQLILFLIGVNLYFKIKV